MEERYNIIKILYPDYLILFKTKEKINYYGNDKKLVDFFGLEGLNDVNKIILNNLDIEYIEKYEYNEYETYNKKYQLIKVIKEAINEE